MNLHWFVSWYASFLYHTLCARQALPCQTTHAMQQVEVKLKSTQHIRRRVLLDTQTIFDVFTAITDLIQQEEPGCDTKVDVSNVSQRVLGNGTMHYQISSIDITISNVCGKVTHFLPQFYKEVHHPHVMPSIRRTNNKFGRFDCLFANKCNLLTSVSRQYTLFRGGNCMKETLDMIGLALLPETIYASTVHMLVMSTRLGRPIQIDSAQIKNTLITDNRWTASLPDTIDDSDYKCSLMMSKFNTDVWREIVGVAHEEPVYLPAQIKLMVTKRGNVNFFLSMQHAPLTEHETIARHTKLMLTEIINVLLKCT